MPSRARARRVAAGAVLVVFGVAAGLAVLEVALQLGALVTRGTGGDLPLGAVPGRTRVLCLGDSNTYGFYLERSEAYPQVLEQLAAGDGGRPLEVLNLGQPGINSSRLRNHLPRMLATFRPDVVTLMVGANDFWTVPEPLAGGAGEGGGWSDSLWRLSRVYRLLYMLRRSLDQPRLEVSIPPEAEIDPGLGQGRAEYGGQVFTWEWRHQEGGIPDFAPALRANLLAMANLVRQAGAAPIVLTYPSEAPVYGATNRVLRESAGDGGLLLVDLGAAFRPRCPTVECPDLFFPDHHPRAEVHRIAAGLILERLRGRDPAGAADSSLRPRTILTSAPS